MRMRRAAALIQTRPSPSIIIPPRLHPPRPPLKEDEDNELNEIELAGILDLSMTDTPGDTLNFPRPPSCSSSTAARPAKNQKTKNSSNKNRDRTSIVGSISKLIDSLSTNTNEGEDVNVAKRMNILMMRQLDLMDRRMEMRDKEDHKEQHKKKKKRQKKKRAKKRMKKATQVALEDQDDHGGKVGPGTADGYNSSSSRSSSISSNSSGDDSTV